MKPGAAADHRVNRCSLVDVPGIHRTAIVIQINSAAPGWAGVVGFRVSEIGECQSIRRAVASESAPLLG